jgi:minor extracellular serine protease Vpr
LTVEDVPVFAAKPGIFEIPLAPGGPMVAAAIHLDGQLVTPSNPAQRGEILSLFLTGAGAVQPSVPTGAIGPLPPATTALPVAVGVAGVGVPVLFSGYAPGFIGLYQINFQVPTGAPSGPNLSLDVKVGSANGKTSSIAVQ